MTQMGKKRQWHFRKVKIYRQWIYICGIQYNRVPTFLPRWNSLTFPDFPWLLKWNSRYPVNSKNGSFWKINVIFLLSAPPPLHRLHAFSIFFFFFFFQFFFYFFFLFFIFLFFQFFFSLKKNFFFFFQCNQCHKTEKEWTHKQWYKTNRIYNNTVNAVKPVYWKWFSLCLP